FQVDLKTGLAIEEACYSQVSLEQLTDALELTLLHPPSLCPAHSNTRCPHTHTQTHSHTHMHTQDFVAHQLPGPTDNGSAVGEAFNEGLHNEPHSREGECAFVSDL